MSFLRWKKKKKKPDENEAPKTEMWLITLGTIFYLTVAYMGRCMLHSPLSTNYMFSCMCLVCKNVLDVCLKFW